MSSPNGTTRPTGTPLATMRTLVATLMGSLVVFGVVTAFVLPRTYPSPLLALGLGVLAVVAFAAAELVGYKVPAVEPGAGQDRTRPGVLAAFQAALFLRFALCEAVGILGLVVAFVQRSWWAYVIAAVYALALVWWHCWPSDRLVAKVEAAFDRSGGRSHLADALHGREPGAGPGPLLPT